MPLPTFSPEIPVHSANAKQDKIEVIIDMGCIRLNDYPGREPDDVRGLLQGVWRHFAGPGRDPDDLELMRTGYHSRLFGRSRPLQIITNPRPGIGPGSLFAGQLRLNARTSPEIEIGLEFVAYLNPSRYVAHQWPEFVAEGQSRFANEAEQRDSLFRRRENADGTGRDEFSLDGTDNWLPTGARFESFSGSWRTRLHEYVGAVRSALTAEIERVCICINHSGNPVLWHPSSETEWFVGDTSLQRIETYWEFQHDDPLQLVNSLEAELRAYCSSEVVVRNYPGRSRPSGDSAIVAGQERNCRVLDAEVAPGIRLVIYAKTNQRVRFEIRHTLHEQSHRRGHNQRCDGVAGTCERLAEVAEDSAEVLNRFFRFLRARVDFVSFSNSPLTLLYECARCAERAAYGDAVLHMLISQERVTRLPALTTTIRAMVRAHILERVENEQGTASEAFVVAPHYRHALSVLRQLSAEHPITGTVRRRRIRTPQGGANS